MSEEEAIPSNLRAANRTDPGCKYYQPLKEEDTNSIVCNFCKKISNGGITRAKVHLMGKKGNVAPCTKCPKEVREELWGYVNDKKKEDIIDIVNIRKLDDIESLGYYENEEDDLANCTQPSNATGRKNALKKGPMDLFCRKLEAAIGTRKKENLRQTSIREKCDKETTARIHQYIARFWYQAGLSFNLIKLKNFEDMVTAIGAYGPHLPVPSYHDIRVPLLSNEMEYTKDLMKGHKEQWSKHGCSTMSDAWIDRKHRSIINFLVNSSAGTMFVKSIDGSDFVKTGEKLFQLLDSLVEEIGEENVVQVITDNGSNYVLAGKMLENKRPHLYWTPCATHCIDLILEEIGKLPLIKKTIKRAINLVGFIYSHSSTLSLLRYFTNKRELVRHRVTRFATSYLSLERLHKEKVNLRRMFTSNEWNSNKLSRDAKGKEAAKVVLMPSFWNHVVFTLKVMAPLVRVLRLVDGERKPAMGYIYEAMKAKETMMKSFNNNEDKYKDVFQIIDEKWSCQLHKPLHGASHLLNPGFFYDNPTMEFDFEVNNGLYECIKKLVPSSEVQKHILAELPLYKSAGGLFGCDFAKSQRKTLAPAQWWRMYSHQAPNLQKLTIKILSLTCNASGCERNWSVFEQIHTKKRNRMDHKKMHDLVYVKYNQQLKRTQDIRDEIDLISLNDIDKCNEWLVGEMDEDDDAGNELVFDDDNTLNWATVYEASGVGEPRVYTRKKTKKRKQSSRVLKLPKLLRNVKQKVQPQKGKKQWLKMLKKWNLRRMMKNLKKGTRVSNELGAGHPWAAQLAVQVVLVMALIEGTLVGTVMILIRNIWAYAYSNEREVAEYVAIMLPILAVSNFLDGLQCVLSGTARGCRWQKIGAFINLGSYYLVGIPSAIVLAFVLCIGGKGLWLGIICALFVQVLSLIIITSRTDWEQEAKKATDRVYDSMTPENIVS